LQEYVKTEEEPAPVPISVSLASWVEAPCKKGQESISVRVWGCCSPGDPEAPTADAGCPSKPCQGPWTGGANSPTVPTPSAFQGVY